MEEIIIDIPKINDFYVINKLLYPNKYITNIRFIFDMDELSDEDINIFLDTELIIDPITDFNERSEISGLRLDKNNKKYCISFCRTRIIEILLINKLFFNKNYNNYTFIPILMFNSLKCRGFNLISLFFKPIFKFKLQFELIDYIDKQIRVLFSENMFFSCLISSYVNIVDLSHSSEDEIMCYAEYKMNLSEIPFRIINFKNFRFLIMSIYDVDLYNLKTILSNKLIPKKIINYNLCNLVVNIHDVKYDYSRYNVLSFIFDFNE
jgi:hypothetical protein